MIKIIISALLLLSVHSSAGSVDGEFTESKKACDGGIMSGCENLGLIYLLGDGVEQNTEEAKKLFEKACKKRYARGCYRLGTMYKRGEDGIEKDIRRSRMFYSLACTIGYAKACEQYNLIRGKKEIKGSGKNVTNSGYTYTTEIYGG